MDALRIGFVVEPKFVRFIGPITVFACHRPTKGRSKKFFFSGPPTKAGPLRKLETTKLAGGAEGVRKELFAASLTRKRSSVV